MMKFNNQAIETSPEKVWCVWFGIFFVQIFNSLSIPCDSCGNECANACGTKHFRTCCFNYLRKRSDPELFTNKRLIDVMMLQGRAMYTENELRLQTEFALANIEPQIVLNGDKCIDSNMPAQLIIPYGVQARNHNDIVTKATLANLISTDLPLSASLLRSEATFIFLA
uniref:Uncharacterized protein n=1 Tax=Glossina austeni TaxID=7395 RepID=A0A1A9VBA5_GLOAU